MPFNAISIFFFRFSSCQHRVRKREKINQHIVDWDFIWRRLRLVFPCCYFHIPRYEGVRKEHAHAWRRRWRVQFPQGVFRAEKAFSSTYAVVSGKCSTFSANVSFDNIGCTNGVVTVVGRFIKDGKVVKTQTMKVNMSSDKEIAAYTFNESNGFSLLEEYCHQPLADNK